MKYLLPLLILLAGCETKVSVPDGVDLANKTFMYCDSPNHTESFRYTYRFSEGAWVTKVIESFDQADCDDRDLIAREQQSLSYSYNPSSRMLRETRISAKMRFTTQVEVNKRNLNEFCRFNDWRLNSDKIITNENCDGEVFSNGDFREYETVITNDGLIINGITFLKFN